jgi:hypothetical protein
MWSSGDSQLVMRMLVARMSLKRRWIEVTSRMDCCAVLAVIRNASFCPHKGQDEAPIL